MKANFGDRPFSYTEGHAHRDAADVPEGETLEERVALLKELPFYPWEEDEMEDVPPQEKEQPLASLPPFTNPPTAPTVSSESIDEKVPAEGMKYEPLVITIPTKELEVPKPITKGNNTLY